MIKKGDILKTTSGREITVGDGPYSGGQGSVYRVQNVNDIFALKCYHDEYLGSEEKRKIFWDALLQIVGKTPSDAFAWPIELVKIGNSFGYIMEWVDHGRFIEINTMKTGNSKYNPSMQIKALISLNICTAFSHLHAKGLCYRDINAGNILFDPQNGEIKIVDNDNVGVEGHSTSNVRGVPDFMAPEILRDCENVSPSKRTDYHSLAVYLFELWCWHHPFEGAKAIECRCFDRTAKLKFFGEEPLFIFSDTDRTNFLPEIADKGTKDEADYRYVHKFWKACTKELQTLFQTAFGDGVNNPEKRLIEATWSKVFQKIYDTTNICPNCSAENCFTPNEPCWSCGKAYKAPLLLTVKNKNNNTISSTLSVMPKTQLLKRHFTKKYSDKESVGIFNTHPNNPKIVGLKNESGGDWTFVNEKGEPVPVPSGRSVPVAISNVIDFGNNYTGEFIGG
jgi:serine/threonine protein kinase